MRRSPVLQHAACGSRVPFGGVGCPGPQAGCNHARAAAWCTPAGSSITQPYNSHCSSICCVVESPCWARVWVRMRVQQRLHLVPAAGGYLPRSLLRFRSSCSRPRQFLAYRTLTQRGSCISVHYDACLDRSSRGVAVWQASACGCRGHAAGSVAADSNPWAWQGVRGGGWGCGKTLHLNHPIQVLRSVRYHILSIS